MTLAVVGSFGRIAVTDVGPLAGPSEGYFRTAGPWA